MGEKRFNRKHMEELGTTSILNELRNVTDAEEWLCV